jgi:hypothetical protein
MPNCVHPTIAIVARRWRVWAVLVEGPHVAAESREMAGWLGDHLRAPEIAGCQRQVEFEGTHIRPGSKCYGDMLRACRVMASFHGVVVIDLERGETLS